MMKATRLALVALVVTASGCVSSRAGYDEATKTLAQRTGVNIHPHAVDDEDSAAAVHKLLSRTLTADAASKVALLHNPEVQAAFDRIGVARGNLVAALRLPNPRLEGAVRFRSGASADIALGGTINIMDLILLPVRQGAASSELDAASLEAAGTAMDVAFEARTAYYDAVAAEQSLELAKSVTLAADAASELARRLAEAGNVPSLEALSESAMYEESRLMFAEAEAQRMLSRERLNAAMGLWGEEGSRWTVSARLDEPSGARVEMGGAETKAIEKSLELAIAKDRYAAAARQANAARAQGVLPELNVGVDAERREEGPSTAATWGVGPKVGIGIPLFYQGQGAVDASHAEMRRQRDLTDGLAIQIRSEARALVLRLESSRDRVGHYQKTLLPLREHIVAETQLQYNAMGSSAFQLLAAKQAQVETARGYVNSLRDYWAARTALDLLLAGRLNRPLAHDFGLGVRVGGASSSGD